MPASNHVDAIPLLAPDISPADQDQVQRCLASGWVSTAGPWVDTFEADMAQYLGSPFAVAVSSGTAALHLSLQVAGVQAGDLVLLSNLTFVAPANAIRYLGADPILVDVEADTWQLSPDLVQSFLEDACQHSEDGCYHRASGRRIAAMVVVHALGYAAAVDQLLDLSQAHGIPLIEDAAEAMGSHLHGRPLGTWGQLGCLSFNGNKLLTTGGGGMVLSQDEAMAASIKHLSTQARQDAFTYQHDAIGYNYRLNSMGAALGSSQLQRLPELLAAKAHIAASYREALPAMTWPKARPNSLPNHWLPTLLLDQRDQVAKHLQTQGIQTRALWTPMNRLPMFEDCLYLSQTDVSGGLAAQSLSLPASVHLSQSQQQRVIAEIQQALAQIDA